MIEKKLAASDRLLAHRIRCTNLDKTYWIPVCSPLKTVTIGRKKKPRDFSITGFFHSMDGFKSHITFVRNKLNPEMLLVPARLLTLLGS